MAIVVTAMVCFAISASAASLASTGKCGNNVTWSYNSSTKELVISGSGEMYDYESYDYTPFDEHDIETIVVKSGVTSIGDYAFSYCYDLVEFDFSGTVETTGDYAFKGCESLRNIIIEDGVIEIGDYAFYDCPEVLNVEISDTVRSIGECAFDECCSLESVRIGKNVEYIGYLAFCDCDSLLNITVDEDNQHYYSDEYGVLFDENINILIQYPGGNPRTSYSIPDSVFAISDCAFSDCYSIESVTTGNELYSIGVDAFAFCYNLTDITLPESLSIVGEYAFDDCTGLTDVYYGGTKEQWQNINFEDYNECLLNADIHFRDGVVGLGKPETIKAVQNTSTIKLTWTSVPNATGYRVYQRVGNGWQALGNTANTTATIKNLTTGTKYTFAVIAGAIYNGKVVWADTYSVINTATKTINPRKVAAAQNTSAIKISWSSCPGATGYRIYYQLGDTWKIAVSATSGTSYTFTNLKPGRKYTFSINPYIIHGNNVIWSASTFFTAATKPQAPTSNARTTSSSITLSWNKVSAEGYRVYYRSSSSGWRIAVNSTTANTCTFGGLRAGNKYIFAVRPYIKTSLGVIWGDYKELPVTVK